MFQDGVHASSKIGFSFHGRNAKKILIYFKKYIVLHFAFNKKIKKYVERMKMMPSEDLITTDSTQL